MQEGSATRQMMHFPLKCMGTGLVPGLLGFTASAQNQSLFFHLRLQFINCAVLILTMEYFLQQTLGKNVPENCYLTAMTAAQLLCYRARLLFLAMKIEVSLTIPSDHTENF